MARQPQAAEGGRGGQRAEDHGARQGRLQQAGLTGPPRHDVVDLERDADAEQQRQRDDVGEVELRARSARRFRASPRRRAAAGSSVSSTSVKRRRTIHSRIAIDRKAQRPASMKARTTVWPDSRIEIGPPLARGSTASTARANSRSTSLSLGSPFGWASTRARPSAVIQFALRSGGRLSARDRLAPRATSRKPSMRGLERRHERGLRARRAAPGRRSQAAPARSRAALAAVGARAGLLAGRLRQARPRRD